MHIKFTEKSIKNIVPNGKPFEVYDSQHSGFLLRVQPTGKKTFYFRYKSPSGVSARLKLGGYGEITLTMARELLISAAGDLAKGIDPQAARKLQREEAKKQKVQTLRYFVNEHFRSWVLKHRKSGSFTLEVLERCFGFLMDKPLNGISVSTIEKWQIRESDRGLNPATINRNLACLKGALTKAVESGYIEKNPIRGVKNVREIDSERIRFLSSREEERLKATLRQRNQKLVEARNRANSWRSTRGYDLYPAYTGSQFVDHIEPMVLLAMNTGMRKGEIFSLQWQDVDLDRNLITIRAANAKSSKVRHIPLNPCAVSTMESWQEQQAPSSGLVFKNQFGKKFRDIRKAWDAVLDDASIEDFRFHDLRHHFASKLVMRGAHLNTVRELLGHSDISTTLRYAHLAQDHKAEAVMLLEA